ncbi:uncharacterized protein LOC120263279 [Dioscorea cayenensis subsp. rotundata]|uniref:Uncharacterized protein LOC120263279 n=1 Tax=Dioscorea cayennensis subsp. rotundata TaxID=55577 RepID=A0AB40BKI6_DIOCR|nr:uncharacterized protein LOC120263279 [Dioscorea cayenensis subsp. rotundata]
MTKHDGKTTEVKGKMDISKSALGNPQENERNPNKGSPLISFLKDSSLIPMPSNQTRDLTHSQSNPIPLLANKQHLRVRVKYFTEKPLFLELWYQSCEVVDESVLHRLGRFESAKEAWDHLKNEDQGSSRMILVRQQTLRQNFDLLQMREDEAVQHFITRVLAVVNQIRGMRIELKEDEVVLKVMRSLSLRFVHVVTSIEEARDLKTMTLDELSSALQAHEARYNQFFEKHGDKTFIVQGDKSGDRNVQRVRVRGFRGRGRTNGNWRRSSYDQRHGGQRQQGSSECNTWQRGRVGSRSFGRFSRGQRQFGGQRFSRGDDTNASEYGNLFLVHGGDGNVSSSLWLLDSGCSNHMTGDKNLFYSLDESVKHNVKLGNDKDVEVQGRGLVMVIMQRGIKKLIHNVKYVQQLAHNLLSIRQVTACDYEIVFKKTWCRIMNVAGELVLMLHRNSNNLYPIEFSAGDYKQVNLVNRRKGDLSLLWHHRYGHLHFQGLENFESTEACNWGAKGSTSRYV